MILAPALGRRSIKCFACGNSPIADIDGARGRLCKGDDDIVDDGSSSRFFRDDVGVSLQ